MTKLMQYIYLVTHYLYSNILRQHYLYFLGINYNIKVDRVVLLQYIHITHLS